MITYPPPLRRQRRIKSKKKNQPTPPPAALTLVSASYDESFLTVTLVFDRAVKIDAFDGAQIVVEDQPNAWELVGTSAEMLDAATVQVALLQIDTASGYEVLLDASGATGIVAVDGGAWSGVTGLELPFP